MATSMRDSFIYYSISVFLLQTYKSIQFKNRNKNAGLYVKTQKINMGAQNTVIKQIIVDEFDKNTQLLKNIS